MYVRLHSKDPERVRATTLQTRKHGLAHRAEVVTQPPPDLAREVVVQPVSRVRDDVDERERMLEVSAGIARRQYTESGENGERVDGKWRYRCGIRTLVVCCAS